MLLCLPFDSMIERWAEERSCFAGSANWSGSSNLHEQNQSIWLNSTVVSIATEENVVDEGQLTDAAIQRQPATMLKNG